MPDPIEQAIEEEVERRVAERLRQAQAEVLAVLRPYGVPNPGDLDGGERMTRSDVARELGVTPSKLRTLEKQRAVSVTRGGPGGGRVMLDPAEVADALGIEYPPKPRRK